MIYLFLTYIIFQVVYDNWIPDNHFGSMIYFSFQYIWIGGVALIEAMRSRYYIFYLIFALIMIIFGLCEIINEPTATPGVTWFNLVVIIFLISSLIKWTGLKKIGRKLY